MPKASSELSESDVESNKIMKSSEDTAATYNAMNPAENDEAIAQSEDIVKSLKKMGAAATDEEKAAARLALDAAMTEPPPPQTACWMSFFFVLLNFNKPRLGRDWSAPCPEDFEPTSNGCKATDKYKGKCPKDQPGLHKYSEAQKQSFTRICGGTYPCMPAVCEHGTHWAAQCPVDWEILGNGYCQAPELHELLTDECPKTMTFADFSDEDKEVFNARYNTRFPCLVDTCLKRDFSSHPCPLAWRLTADGFCVPPPWLKKGKCSEPVNLSAKSPLEREVFAEGCNGEVQYQMSEGCAKSCKKDYSARCPLHWTDAGDGSSCDAPVRGFNVD
eukprot:Selendium_serpulae@DN4555_c0_g1_i1.p1